MTNEDGKSVVTEPGGQANKPYMIQASFDASRRYLNSCIIMTANSSMVGIKKLSEYQGKNYDLTLYVKTGKEKWVKIATLGFGGKPMQLIDGSVNWGVTRYQEHGSIVPSLKFPTSISDIAGKANQYFDGTIDVKVNTLGAFRKIGKTIRVASWDGKTYQTTWVPGPYHTIKTGALDKKNQLGKPVYSYVITYNFTDVEMKNNPKCLVVASDSY